MASSWGGSPMVRTAERRHIWTRLATLGRPAQGRFGGGGHHHDLGRRPRWPRTPPRQPWPVSSSRCQPSPPAPPSPPDGPGTRRRAVRRREGRRHLPAPGPGCADRERKLGLHPVWSRCLGCCVLGPDWEEVVGPIWEPDLSTEFFWRQSGGVCRGGTDIGATLAKMLSRRAATLNRWVAFSGRRAK